MSEQAVGVGLVVALGWLGAQLDPLQPLDAARADVARHHRAQRRAVHGRQRLAVHLPREQDLGPQRLVARDRDLVELRRVGLLGVVGAGEADVARGGVDAGGGQHVGQRRPGPARGAGGARAPRGLAGDVAHAHQVGAAVARALQRHGQLAARQRLQVGRRQLERLRHQPVDAQRARRLRHRPVVADVEALDRGQRRAGQRGARRLRVERLPLVDDRVRRLAEGAHSGTIRSIRVAL